MKYNKKICVVIPCYKVKKKIYSVIRKINFKLVDKVFIIDDLCPEKTGIYVRELNLKNVEVIFLKKNLGVGGATKTGFKKALKDNFEIKFKIDGDGKHNHEDISKFIKKLIRTNINFCKGTRFKKTSDIKKIPALILFGNILLTNITRINCRNFALTDVLNGYLGIKRNLLKKLNFSKISDYFFFEEDLLFRTSFLENNICEIPIKTIYFDKSNLSPLKTIVPFLYKHLKNFFERFIYDISK